MATSSARVMLYWAAIFHMASPLATMWIWLPAGATVTAGCATGVAGLTGAAGVGLGVGVGVGSTHGGEALETESAPTDNGALNIGTESSSNRIKECAINFFT